MLTKQVDMCRGKGGRRRRDLLHSRLWHFGTKRRRKRKIRNFPCVSILLHAATATRFAKKQKKRLYSGIPNISPPPWSDSYASQSHRRGGKVSASCQTKLFSAQNSRLTHLSRAAVVAEEPINKAGGKGRGIKGNEMFIQPKYETAQR